MHLACFLFLCLTRLCACVFKLLLVVTCREASKSCRSKGAPCNNNTMRKSMSCSSDTTETLVSQFSTFSVVVSICQLGRFQSSWSLCPSVLPPFSPSLSSLSPHLFILFLFFGCSCMFVASTAELKQHYQEQLDAAEAEKNTMAQRLAKMQALLESKGLNPGNCTRSMFSASECLYSLLLEASCPHQALHVRMVVVVVVVSVFFPLAVFRSDGRCV